MNSRFFKYIYTVLFLFASLSFSFGGTCSYEIEAGSGLFKGRAEGVPLGKVLSSVAEKTGCEIHVDKRIDSIPISFSILKEMPLEAAVRQMIHPHSYAVLYQGIPDKDRHEIKALWIVHSDGGEPGEYIKYKAGNMDPGTEDKAISDMSGNLNVPRYFNGRKDSSRNKRFKKGVFGSPVDQSVTSPVYRNDNEMRRAYRKHLHEKRVYGRYRSISLHRHMMKKKIVKTDGSNMTNFPSRSR